MAETKKQTYKKAGKTIKILGIGLNSTSISEVLRKIEKRIRDNQKTFIVTPNPEFLVFGQQNPWFKEILNSADISLPDGVGLVWAGRILGRPLKGRVTGADLTVGLLELAVKNRWQVGVVGARRGMVEERRRQVEILRQKYPGLKILALEDTPGWQKERLEIVFACQGMGEQEKWIVKHLPTSGSLVFLGAGGSLDFLSGFARRAPLVIRLIGFEWFWRLIHQPCRWRRQLALLKFVWLVLTEKFFGI